MQPATQVSTSQPASAAEKQTASTTGLVGPSKGSSGDRERDRERSAGTSCDILAVHEL